MKGTLVIRGINWAGHTVSFSIPNVGLAGEVFAEEGEVEKLKKGLPMGIRECTSFGFIADKEKEKDNGKKTSKEEKTK